MPVTYEFEGTILLLWMVGRYAASDIRAAVARALAEPGRPLITGMVSDLRSSSSLMRRSLGDITGIVGYLAYVAPSVGNRIALVVSTDAADMLARMWVVDLRIGGVQAETFRCIDDARGWMAGPGELRRDDRNDA